MATNIYTAILTDTGGFRHENTSEACLLAAAKLARLGAQPGDIAGKVYKSRPLTTLKLQAISLAKMEVSHGGRLTWATVSRAMLKEAGAVMAESEGIIDTLNSIAGLEVAILFKEVNSSITKISVRSRGAIDAAAFCGGLGGGGHMRAAGAEIQRPMDQAIALVLGAADDALAAIAD
jgi:phosphoesterase RecJ-like protein